MRATLVILATTLSAFAADEINAPKSTGPTLEQSLKSLAVAPGLRVDLWAAEPLLKDPVAFTFDNQGRCYVAETGRRRTSMQDIRKNEDWIVENLALRSVEDRVAFLKKKLAPELKLRPDPSRPDMNKDGQFDWRDLEFESETIRVIEDTDGDGRADKSRVFAEGFNSLATGIGAGLVVGPDGNLYYTCVPDLWLIKPDGTKQKLSTGYGAHVVYSGHDMHGARIGPDGRLYFSIGDAGASVVGGDGKKIECPDSGAIFRCWPDGTGLELFAWGLRNPQHLAFNDVGDLFTCDNNADGGDKARLIHVVEGGDYGWRIGHQFMPKLGIWNSEGQWHLDAAEKNAAILPPVAHIGHGPAGFSFYPGTGLPEKYAGHFFMADFPGGVRAFKLKQKGATYELDGFAPDAPVLQNNAPGEMTAKLLWNLDPSDVQFAPGGGVYVLDWTKGWEKSGRGRIFRVHDPATDASPIVQETKRLLAEDFGKKSADELAKLLGHADQRVRLKAQFEFSRRGMPVADTLLSVIARKEAGILARLHAIWVLTQIEPAPGKIGEALAGYMNDENAELRAQVVKVFGEKQRHNGFSGSPATNARLIGALKDSDARVRFFAAQSLAHSGTEEQQSQVRSAFGVMWGTDPNLSHAFVRAAKRCVGELSIAFWTVDPSSDAVKVAACLVLRAKRSQHLSSIIKGDWSSAIVSVTAARAIHDVPIPEAMPELAAMLDVTHASSTQGKSAGGTPAGPTAGTAVPLYRRIVNANYRLGTVECAKRLANAAANAELPEIIRADALDALANWPANLGRDRVLGLVMPGDGKRSAGDAAAAIATVFAKLASDKSDAIRIAALDAASANKAKATEPAVTTLANDAAQPGKVRAVALAALEKLNANALGEVLQTALASPDKVLAAEARRIAGRASPERAVELAARAFEKGSVPEQQAALAALANAKTAKADALLVTQLDRLATGKVPAAVQLDLLEASATRVADTKTGADTGAPIAARLAAFEQARKADDPLAKWRECLDGGDATMGAVIFQEKAEAGCMRCHKVNKIGGDVGPELAGLGVQKGREYLLRAIVAPDADSAPGYDNVLVTLKDGTVVAGVVASDDGTTLTLKNPADGKPQRVRVADIKERTKLPSAMPPGLGEVLGKRALRDVLEYLATRK